MTSDSLLVISKLLLPEVLIEHLNLTSHKIKEEEIHFYFKEDNTIPIEFIDDKLTSKGFFAEATIQDFPIGGKKVYLYVTRRKWISETTGGVASRDWSLVAKGTRMTKEFATFF